MENVHAVPPVRCLSNPLRHKKQEANWPGEVRKDRVGLAMLARRCFAGPGCALNASVRAVSEDVVPSNLIIDNVDGNGKHTSKLLHQPCSRSKLSTINSSVVSDAECKSREDTSRGA